MSTIRMGSCTQCSPRVRPGQSGCPDATVLVTVTDVLSANPKVYSAGTFSAGRYAMRYCGGAWADLLITPPWTVDDRSGLTSKTFDVLSNGSVVNFEGQPVADFFNTEQDAIGAFQCMKATFAHPGGNISLRYMDDPPLTDNTVGTSPVVFGLWRQRLIMSIESLCASWTIVNSTASLHVIFRNLTENDWTGINMVCEFIESHGTTVVTTSVGDLLAGQGGNLDVAFSASSPSKFVNIHFEQADTPNTDIVEYYLAPVITMDKIIFAGASSCGDGTLRKTQSYNYNFINKGNWSTDVVCVFTHTPALSNCHAPTLPGTLTCGLSRNAGQTLIAPAVTQDTIFGFSFSDGHGNALGDINTLITVPA